MVFAEHELFRLFQFQIVQKHEIYTLAQLRHFYEEKSAEGETKSTLRSIDLENKIVKKLEDKLKFMKSSQSSTSNTTEMVMSVDELVLSNCLSTVLLEGCVEKSLHVKIVEKL